MLSWRTAGRQTISQWGDYCPSHDIQIPLMGTGGPAHPRKRHTKLPSAWDTLGWNTLGWDTPHPKLSFPRWFLLKHWKGRVWWCCLSSAILSLEALPEGMLCSRLSQLGTPAGASPGASRWISARYAEAPCDDVTFCLIPQLGSPVISAGFRVCPIWYLAVYLLLFSICYSPCFFIIFCWLLNKRKPPA